MIFIPLMTVAFTTISKEHMGNATSIFNLLRNIAGSFGIAFMTTILARRAQFHQFRFVEHLHPFDMKYQIALQKTHAVLAAKGQVSSQAGNGLIYQELMRQAHLFAFTDAFYMGAVIILCVVPLIFLLKRPIHAAVPSALH